MKERGGQHKDLKQFRGLSDSFNYAISGIVHGLKTQRNMQLHVVVMVLVLLASLFLDLTRIELAVIFFAIGLVLISEMVNTAIESIVDLIIDTHHKIAGTAKDIGAGAVLIASIIALTIGYLILYNRIHMPSPMVLRTEYNLLHVSFVSLALVLILVVAAKASVGKGTFLRGGMPSGHSAIAMCIWVIVTFVSQSILISLLVLIASILLCQSRLKTGIHSFQEVAVGALIGGLITLLIFIVCGVG
ncbi:MAG: diacylglycerol kinase [bacterium]